MILHHQRVLKPCAACLPVPSSQKQHQAEMSGDMDDLEELDEDQQADLTAIRR